MLRSLFRKLEIHPHFEHYLELTIRICAKPVETSTGIRDTKAPGYTPLSGGGGHHRLSHSLP